MNLRSFIDECKRRKVLSTISIYGLSAWVLIQVAATTFPYLGFPKIAITAIIILVLIFFPIVIIFSWFFNVVPDPDPDYAYDRKRNKWTIILISSLITLVSIFLIIRLIKSPGDGILQNKYTQDNITVLEFENFTQNDSLDMLGKMAADWISHSIVEHKVGSVIEPETLREYQNLSSVNASVVDLSAISKLLKTNLQVIKGAYYIENDQLIIQCRILKSNNPLESHAFENTVVNLDNRLEAIELTVQKVLGYFSVKDDRDLIDLKRVPTFDAYQNYLTAKDIWRKDYEYSERLLRKALQQNSEFIQARDLLMRILYNTRQYAALDSMINRINTSDLSSKQDDILNFMKSLLDGENREAYKVHNKIVEKHPKDLNLNIEAMVTALEFVNKPQDVIEIHDRIDNEKFSKSDCTYCRLKNELLARAYMENGNYRYAEKILKRLSETSNRRQTFELLIKTYVKQGRDNDLKKLLTRAQKTKLDKDGKYLYYIASRDYYLEDKGGKADKYAEIAIEKYKGSTLSKMQGRTQYMSGDLRAAQITFENFLDIKPEDTYTISKLAQIHFKLGNKENAMLLLESMEEFERPYLFGSLDYHRAQAYANMEMKDEAFIALEKAVSKGKRFQLSDFYNDTDLMSLHSDDRFQSIMNYWHD